MKTPWIILHIPHASTFIPDSVLKSFKLNEQDIDWELRRLTDHYTVDLFQSIGSDESALIFPISRFAVDPERFREDDLEPMSEKGQGVLYTKTCSGSQLRAEPTAKERRDLLETYYDPHHARLDLLVREALESHGKALIIDCHSFPSKPLPVDQNQKYPRPDICFGTDSFHTPENLLANLLEQCEDFSWRAEENDPYEGTIVPLSYYRKDIRVTSVMIEVNRRLYLKDEPENIEKSDDYGLLKQRIRMLIDAAIESMSSIE